MILQDYNYQIMELNVPQAMQVVPHDFGTVLFLDNVLYKRLLV